MTDWMRVEDGPYYLPVPKPARDVHGPFLHPAPRPRTLGVACLTCVPLGPGRVPRLIARMRCDADAPDFQPGSYYQPEPNMHLTAVGLFDFVIDHANLPTARRVDPELLEAARSTTALTGNPVDGLRLIAEHRQDHFMAELLDAERAMFLTSFVPHLVKGP